MTAQNVNELVDQISDDINYFIVHELVGQYADCKNFQKARTLELSITIDMNPDIGITTGMLLTDAAKNILAVG